MKVSNCCGARPRSNGYCDSSDLGICPECREHCEYEDGEDEETTELKDKMKYIYQNYPNLDYVNPEYRKYHGQIKRDDND